MSTATDRIVTSSAGVAPARSGVWARRGPPGWVGLAMALVLGLGACAESVESENVFTDGMYADLEARATETGTQVSATLRVGGATSNTYVMLGGGDRLRVSAGSESVTLATQSTGDVYRYVATLDTNEGGTEVIFDFQRDLDDGAPDSHCTLPAASDITAPSDGQVIRRADDDLVITWDLSAGPDDRLRLDVLGPCFIDLSETLDSAAGSYLIPAGTIESRNDPPAACSATVRLTSESSGSLDPGFGEGGRVLCRQEREVSIRLDP
ncbi:hypothetical protein [Haliangium sp.]|uniref:hypothetical protein n=1 Tax=Haliangium sp. TaxID=2663208 RepID=UPI003D10D370